MERESAGAARMNHLHVLETEVFRHIAGTRRAIG